MTTLRHFPVILLLLGSLLVVLVAAHKPISLAIGDFLIIRDELDPADVIHVIAGPIDRADYAIQLYQQGYGQRLFFTGGWSPRLNMTYAQFFQEYAETRGVPRTDIRIDDGYINSTYSEALKLRQFLESSPIDDRSVIVVSDPHHMRRTRWAYRRVLDVPHARFQLAPVPFQQSRHQRHWWADRASLNMVVSEYIKIGYYYLRYEYSPRPVQERLAILDEIF